MTKTKALIWVRVSKQEQDYHRQIDDLTKYAQQKNWQVFGIVSEKVSGAVKNSSRKGITDIIAQAKGGKFQKLLVSELSRVGRNAYEVQKVIEELIELGISLAIQNLNIETLDENGKRSPMVDLMISIMAQFAQMERSTLIERVRSGIEKARRSGKILGRPKNTGYDKAKYYEKYPKLIKDIKAGISLRNISKIHEMALSSVVRIKKLVV